MYAVFDAMHIIVGCLYIQHAQLSVLCGEAFLDFKVGLYTTSVLVLVEQQTV